MRERLMGCCEVRGSITLKDFVKEVLVRLFKEAFNLRQLFKLLQNH